jgi:hypothetical protein
MTNFSEWGVDYAFTMMFQFPAGRAELVLGPKAGRFIVETSLRESGTKIDQEVTGFLAGLNAGLFIPATPRTSLGVLLSYEFWWAVHACRSAAGDSDACSSVHDAPTVKVLGLTAAALF